MREALSSAVNATTTTVSNIAQNAAQRVQNAVGPHLGAINAGIAAERIASSNMMAEQSDINRARDIARENYYEQNNVPEHLRAVPTGPASQALLDRSRPGVRVNAADAAMADRIDRAHRNGANVSMPGEITEETGLARLGPAYSQLTPEQRAALERSVVVTGPGLLDSQGASYPSTTFAPGGVVVVDTTNAESFADTLVHEAVHALDRTVMVEAAQDAANLQGRDRNLASQAYDAAVTSLSEVMDAGDEAANLSEEDEDYYASITELRAFDSTQENRDQWASDVQHQHNANSPPNEQMSLQDARDLFDMYQESETLREVNSAISDYTQRNLLD